MNKTEMIANVAELSGLSKKDAGKGRQRGAGHRDRIAQRGEKVSLVGFGNFEVRERAARTGVNPLTKQPMEYAACKVPAFKAGKALKDAVK